MVFLNIGLHAWNTFVQGRSANAPIRQVIHITSIIRSMFTFVAYAFLIAAIFGWRRTDEKFPRLN
jgi:hypothetical protein